MTTPRPVKHPAYRKWAWQKVRRVILARDGYLCQIKGPTCTTKATAVDHITPLSAGGAWYDPGNLRACCQHCNNRRKTKGTGTNGPPPPTPPPPPTNPTRNW